MRLLSFGLSAHKRQPWQHTPSPHRKPLPQCTDTWGEGDYCNLLVMNDSDRANLQTCSGLVSAQAPRGLHNVMPDAVLSARSKI